MLCHDIHIIYNLCLLSQAVPFIVEVFAEDCSPSLKVSSQSPATNKLEKAICQIITNKVCEDMRSGFPQRKDGETWKTVMVMVKSGNVQN